MPLILTNICRGRDIMTRHQVWAWPGDNHLTLMFSDHLTWPQPCLPQQSVSSFQESGCLKDSGRSAPTRRSTWLTWTMTRSSDIRSSLTCFPWLLWAGAGFVLVVSQPRWLPAPAPGWRERGGETGENIKHSEGIIPIFWSRDEYLLIPNFPLSLSHPAPRLYKAQYILRPSRLTFIPKLHRHTYKFQEVPKEKFMLGCKHVSFFYFTFCLHFQFV